MRLDESFETVHGRQPALRPDDDVFDMGRDHVLGGCRIYFPDFADIVLQAGMFVEGCVGRDQPDAAALIQRDPADAGAAPVRVLATMRTFMELIPPEEPFCKLPARERSATCRPEKLGIVIRLRALRVSVVRFW